MHVRRPRRRHTRRSLASGERPTDGQARLERARAAGAGDTRDPVPVANTEPIHPVELEQLSGAERIGPARVIDFWRWALGDLRMNNARGYLVEFLVARALGDESPVRVEWGPHDVRGPDGTLVEVKAAGRLQSWTTKKPSTPAWTFKSVRADRVWLESTGEYVSVDPGDRVHVWVFALQTALDPARYDPLDIDQWEFRVMSHRRLLATDQISARVPFFDRLGIAPIAYSALPTAVASARRDNDCFISARHAST